MAGVQVRACLEMGLQSGEISIFGFDPLAAMECKILPQQLRGSADVFVLGSSAKLLLSRLSDVSLDVSPALEQVVPPSLGFFICNGSLQAMCSTRHGISTYNEQHNAGST